MAAPRVSTDSALTREQVLRAAEDVLRRYGPVKATVLDVARALGVSHGSVYRHFPSKSALREAVAQRWLDRTHAHLAGVVSGGGSAPVRLRKWLRALFVTKRAKAREDPELFATYLVLVRDSSAVTEAHMASMVRQIAQIVLDGAVAGDFRVSDVDSTARAIWDATRRFHDPVYASHWSDPGIDTAFEWVCALVLNGLAAKVSA